MVAKNDFSKLIRVGDVKTKIKQMEEQNGKSQGRMMTSTSGYNFTNFPPGVDLKDIQFLKRDQGQFENYIFAIYKCKNDCDTIFTEKNLEEIITKFVSVNTV